MATKKSLKVSSKEFDNRRRAAEQDQRIRQLVKRIKDDEKILKRSLDNAASQVILERQLARTLSAGGVTFIDPKDEQLRRAIQTECWINQRIKDESEKYAALLSKFNEANQKIDSMYLSIRDHLRDISGKFFEAGYPTMGERIEDTANFVYQHQDIKILTHFIEAVCWQLKGRLARVGFE